MSTDALIAVTGATGHLGARRRGRRRRDVAAAAAAVRLSSEHGGQFFTLTGPERISLAEAAATMAAVAGKPIRYVNVSDAEAYASRSTSGAADWEIAAWISSYQAIRDGAFDVLGDDVRRLTGRAPRSLRDVLAAAPNALAHVGAG